MFDFTCHKKIRVLLEGAQTSLCAEVNPLAAVDGAGKVLRIFEFSTAGSLYSGNESAVV